MSPSYLSPGVYMEEVDKGTKPIEAVGTAVAAFIGFTEKAEDVRNGQSTSLLGKPTLITNWSQYVQKYGGFAPGTYTPDSVYGYFANGGGNCYIISLKTVGVAESADAGSAAVASVQSADSKSKLIEFTAKQIGTLGNNVQVEIKTPPAETPKEGKESKDIAPIGFTIVISVDGKPVETYDNVTLGKGDNNLETLLQTKSQVVTAKIVGKAELAPASGSYSLAGGEVKTKSISLKDYQGDA